MWATPRVVVSEKRTPEDAGNKEGLDYKAGKSLKYDGQPQSPATSQIIVMYLESINSLIQSADIFNIAKFCNEVHISHL